MSESRTFERHAFPAAALRAAAAMRTWLDGRAVSVTSTLDEANGFRDYSRFGDGPLCVCEMTVSGGRGELLSVVLSDASGFALTDLVLGRSIGTSDGWGDVEQSAALESANIIASEYLNALAENSSGCSGRDTLLPSPPKFRRDAAGAGLPTTGDTAVVAHARYELTELSIGWDSVMIVRTDSLDE